MPSAVSDHGPSVFFRLCSGFSESRISLSIDLRHSSWLASGKLLARESLVRTKSVVADEVSSNPSLDCSSSEYKSAGGAAGRFPRLRQKPAHPALTCASPGPRAAFFSFCLFSPRGVVRLALGAAFLRAARFSFFRFLHIFNCRGICHVSSLFLKLRRPRRYSFFNCANFSTSFLTPNFAKCTVSFASSPVPFAQNNDAFAIFPMQHPAALLQSGSTGRLGNIQLRPLIAALAAAKKLRNIVDRVGLSRLSGRLHSTPASQSRHPHVFEEAKPPGLNPFAPTAPPAEG